MREKLVTPNNEKEVLLHSCCAPCSGELIEAMLEAQISPTIFFYNPNIHPEEEYTLRKEEIIRFAKKMNIPFIDADYDKQQWFDRVKGLEWQEERGERCTICFDMRFEKTALYAYENHFAIFTSSLGISRWKDMEQVNRSGIRAASRYKSLYYWKYNWRKKGGVSRMIEISKRENFYKQKYCGCTYSLRDSNKRKREKIIS